MTGEETKWIETVAGMLAVYGVFGLVPVSVWLMYVNLKAYQTSTTETRKHCAAVHWVFVGSTVLLMGAAGLFQYVQSRVKPVLWGSVAGLGDRKDLPASRSQQFHLKQRLDALGHDQFYQTAPILDTRSNRFKLDWALPLDKPVSSLVLRIQQEFTKPALDEGLASPEAGPNSASARADEELVREKDFKIDLNSFPQFRKEPIKLTYTLPRGMPPESIGVLMVQTARGTLRLPVTEFADIRPLHQARSTLLDQLVDGILPKAWAQAPAASDSVAIAEGLHSEDIAAQATARKELVSAGSASCSFIIATLKETRPPEGDDQALLIHNLAKSLEDLERRTRKSCHESYLPFALAYSDLKDFASAVNFFDQVPDTEIRKPEEMYARGYAYYRVGGRDSAAIESLNRYLASSPGPISTTKSHLLLGRVNHRSGNLPEAIGHFRSAMAVKGAPEWAWAMAANELAYLYAESFIAVKDSLRVALPKVEMALAYNPRDPRFLDTKGWLLYGLGRCAEAETLLAQAARAEPTNRVIQRHLREVRSGAERRCT